MLKAPSPFATEHNEATRLQALHALDILDTSPEKTFDEAAQLAAAVCGTPIGLVNLLDKDRQWFKARVGVPVDEMPRKDSFCDHTIGRKTPLVIQDTLEDPTFSDNPYVSGDPNLRFYAGMPLNTSEGHTLGTLCVGDTVPHVLSPAQIDALTALGRQVAAQIELGSKVRVLAKVIQQKEAMERELRARTLLYSAFMDHTPTMSFIKDRDGRFLYYNKVFCERFGISPTEWVDKSVFDLFPAEFATGYHEDDMKVLNSGISETVEEAAPGADGAILYWRTHKFRIEDGNGPDLLGGVSLDISNEREAALKLERSYAQLEDANRQLTVLSQTDGLTGLHNRRAFDERLVTALHEAIPLSLILLDADHFKSLNDSFGHSVGDDVLRILGRLLTKHSRIDDYVARVGGEEFAILLPQTGKREAVALAERLRVTVEKYAWRQRSVTVSLGVVTWPEKIGNAPAFLEAADAALYRAKRNGRNCVETADEAVAMEHCAA